MIVRVIEHTSYVERLGDADVVLADYSVPGFEGMEALDLCQDKAPDTPFIFVSGVIGEEFATDALKRGATDYVVKHRLNRLPAALDRALKEADDRRRARLAEGAWGKASGACRRPSTTCSSAFWKSTLLPASSCAPTPLCIACSVMPTSRWSASRPRLSCLTKKPGSRLPSHRPAGTRVVRQEKRLIGHAGEVIWADMSSSSWPALEWRVAMC